MPHSPKKAFFKNFFLALTATTLALSILFSATALAEEDPPIEINSIEELAAIGNDPEFPLDGNYILETSLDFCDEASYDDHTTSPGIADFCEAEGATAGWSPIGEDENRFTGTFDGQNETIYNLFIETDNETYTGLFSYLGENGEISNLNLENINVSDTDGRVGGLVGYSLGIIDNVSVTGEIFAGSEGRVGLVLGYSHTTGTVKNSSSAGSVTSDGDYSGGLTGYDFRGLTKNSNSSASVNGKGYTGGLIGYGRGTIENSHATGNVFGDGSYVGGLVGLNSGYLADIGLTSHSYATGEVTGTSSRVGGLTGENYSGIISHSYSTGNVTSGGITTGGLVGRNWGAGALVENSFSASNVHGDGDGVGGLVGRNQNNIENSYALGDVTATSDSHSRGGLVGYNDSGRIIRGFSTGEVAPLGGSNGGGLVGNKSTGTGYEDTGNYWNTETSGWETSEMGYASDTYKMKHFRLYNYFEWDILTSSEDINDGLPYLAWQTEKDASVWLIPEQEASFAGGEGTEHSPYQIETYKQLQDMDMDLSAHYELISDLNEHTSDYEVYGAPEINDGKGFFTIGNDENKFTGTFDGNGHTIEDISINRESRAYIGLFGYADEGSEIKNVNLLNFNITGKERVGTLVGETEGLIENVHATGYVTSKNNWGGGLTYAVRSSEGEIKNSSADVEVNVSGTYAGGLVGLTYGNVSDSHSYGNVTGSSDYSGGLIGRSYANTTNSSAEGYVVGSRYVGGLIGENDGGDVISSHATGTVLSTYGSTSIFAAAGGLVGQNSGGNIYYSSSSGSVTGNLSVGGLVGRNTGTISQSYAIGPADGYREVGGLVGRSLATGNAIKNSYAKGSVSAFSQNFERGGLVGDASGTQIINSYSTGSVSHPNEGSNGGGLVGDSSTVTTSNSYWDMETSGWTTSEEGIGKTTSEMNTPETFTIPELEILADEINMGSSVTTHEISDLTSHTRLIMGIDESSDSAGIAETLFDNEHIRIHFGYHRGDEMSADGWEVFETIISYMSPETQKIVYNQRASSPAAYDLAFIDRLENMGFTVETVQDTEVDTTDYGDVGMLIVGAPGTTWVENHDRESFISELELPILSFCRGTSRNAFDMANASGSTSVSTFYKKTWSFNEIWNIAPSINDGYPFLQWQFTVYNLNYIAGENGSIEGESSQTVLEGISGTEVEAIPDPGYHFVEWSDGSTQNPRTDTDVNEDITVTATFSINSYTVTFQDTDETVIETKSVEHDNPVPEPTSPTKSGYTFDDWYADEELTTPWDFATNTITEDTTIYAKWTVNQYTITYTAGENGTVDGDLEQEVNYDESGTPVTAIPNEGYYFAKWSDEVTTPERTDTIDEHDPQNIEVTAVFATTPSIELIPPLVGLDRALIAWESNVPMSSQILYSRTEFLVRETPVYNTDPRTQDHSILLKNIPSCSVHFFKTRSVDEFGTQAESTVESDVVRFKTGCAISRIVEEEETVAEIISNIEGGVIERIRNESLARLSIKPNSTDKPAVYQINVLDTNQITPPEGLQLVDKNAFSLTAVFDEEDLNVETFQIPVEFMVESTYEGFETSDIFRYNEETEEWDKLECELDEEEQALTCELETFSTFGVFGEAKETEEETPVTPPSTPSRPSGGGGGGTIAPAPKPDEEKKEEREIPEPKIAFKDTEEHWGEDYISILSAKCDVQGYSDEQGNLLKIFGPDDPITRAQLVKMIAGCIEEEVEERYMPIIPPFPDIKTTKWYAPYIYFAKNKKWIEGYPDGTFRPTENINRVEALKVILLSSHTEDEMSKFSQEIPQTDLPNFQDSTPDAWYSHYLNFAASKGFISGYVDKHGVPTGYFGPADNLTRSQAAKIIVEVLEL